MHHGTCVTHVPWCMSESLIRGGGEKVPGIPGACATRNFAYLARGPWNYVWIQWINTLRLRRNCCNFADDIFKCIFLNENMWVSLMMSLKFVSKIRINNIPALVQTMASHWPSDKPLSEPILMISLLTHICITQPQWVNITLWYFSHVGMLKYHH